MKSLLSFRGLANIGLVSCGLLVGCLDPYSPPSSKEPVDFLVVDGNINSTDSIASVSLSRAIKLDDLSDFPVVSDASVIIENESGYFATLTSSTPGVYSVKKYFPKSNQYRLRVNIANKEYVSDLIDLQSNAPIDSINWRTFNDRLEVYASTHDLTEGAKFYRYSYEETYEYTSNYYSGWEFGGSFPTPRPFSAQIYSCWTTKPSSNILLASTESLDKNIISNSLIFRAYKGDRRLWRKISLNVHQTALDKKAFDYWTQIKKMSESLGGLFDPLPYSIKGNISSIDDPEEVVLGYFSGGEVDTHRIIIPNNKLPEDFSGVLQNDCYEEYVDIGSLSSIQGKDYIITRAEYMGGVILIGFYYSFPKCVDCQLEGGTRIEPAFMK